MAFCSNCGKQLVDGAKFCSGCGATVVQTTVEENAKRKVVYEGELHKCPSCGEVLGAFVSVCPVCGYVPYKIGKLQIQGFSEPITSNKTELSHYAKGRPVETTGGLFAWKARKEADIF